MNINNIFKTTSNDNSYYQLESQNLDANGVFQAEYNYGLKEEQILKQNIIINLFQTLIIRILKPFIYPEVSIDKGNMERSINQLKSIGGESIAMRTPDSDIIRGTYLRAKDFKNSIEKYCWVFKKESPGLTQNSYNNIFRIKDEFCIQEECIRECPCSRSNMFCGTCKPNQKAQQFLDNLAELKFSQQFTNEILPCRLCSPRIIDEQWHRVHIQFSSLPKNAPPIDDKITSQPTVLIAAGLDLPSLIYKELAASCLARGLNVMMVDFRGVSISTSHKTKIDLETAYQYLSKEKGVENKDLLLYGHCFGAGPATDLAARRKGIHILVDRSFAKFSNILSEHIIENVIQKLCDLIPWIKEEFFEKLINLIPFSYIIPRIIEYDNATNLSKIQGKIALLINTSNSDDDFISEEEVTKQINSCKEAKIIFTDVGHIKSWRDIEAGVISKSITTAQFNEFLIDAGLARNSFVCSL